MAVVEYFKAASADDKHPNGRGRITWCVILLATSAPSTSLPPPQPPSSFINKVLGRGLVPSDRIERMIRPPYTTFIKNSIKF